MAKKKMNNTSAPLEFNDKTFREDNDADTLARAAEIQADKSRMRGAKAGAKRMLEREKPRLDALKKVSKKKA